MKCPKCSAEMETVNKDESNNPDNGKKYERTNFVCRADDIWITLETPKA